jgi:hypothetical protein
MQTPEPPSPAKNGGWIGGLVGRLLNYADRPWRALFILALILISGIGYAAYQEREALLRVLLHKPPVKPVLRTAEIDNVVTGLFYSTTADAAAVWAWHSGDNTVEYLVGKRRDGQKWEITPKVLLGFSERSGPVIKLLHGEAVCVDPTGLASLLSQALTKDGMHKVCYVPEPPSKTQQLVGFVVIGWQSDPGEAIAEGAVSSVLRQTDNIVIH